MSAQRMRSAAIAAQADSQARLLARLLAAALAWLCLTSPARAAPTSLTVGPWDITFYNSGDHFRYSGGNYFGSRDWTQPAMDDVAAMLTVWDQHIVTAAPTRPIELKLMWGNLGTNVLGSSHNSFEGDGTRAWTEVESLWRQHQDVNNTTDAFLQFGTGITWNIGSQLPSYSTVDFRSVVLHEIGHTLGFLSAYDEGTDRWPAIGITTWDSLLRDASTGGNAPAANSTGSPGNFNPLADPVYFVGPSAMQAYGDRPVPVYAPTAWEAGSSLSHLDDGAFPKALMKHAIGYEQSVRAPTLVEWRIMQDLGWDISLPLLPGDANNDGTVDQADYTIWYNHYGASGGWEQGDFSGDGLVDQSDYTIWYNHYGATSAGVPEPTTAALCALGALAALRARRKKPLATRERQRLKTPAPNHCHCRRSLVASR